MKDERTRDLADAWRCSRQQLLAGRIDSIGAAKERRLILKEAEAEGLLEDVRRLITEEGT